jgi:EmrB/QacA subfamily drug resistance transporter
MTSLENSGQQVDDGHGHSHLGLALVVICVAQLMVVLDATIVNIAIPYIKDDLNFSNGNTPWIITGYTLAFGGLLLLGGRTGDLFGRRRMFMIGVTIFSVASLLGGIAQTQELLLGARALQGVGAAIASPTALALITTTFPAGKQRNRAFAVYAAMSGAGAAVGLILGGWLTDYSWRWTFLINVPIGIGTALLAPYVLGESKPRRVALDLPGALTGTLGLLAVVYGLTRASNLVSEGKDKSWTDPVTLASLIGGAVLLIAFVLIERVTKEPLMPFHILANRTRGVSFAVMMLVPAAMFAMFYFLSRVVQEGMGYSALKCGFAFLPFSVGIVVSAGIASSLASKVDPKYLAGVGTLLSAAGLWGFSRLPTEANIDQVAVTATYVGDLLPWIVIFSFGMGLVFVPLTLTAVHGVGERDSGIGSGVLNAMQQVGGALGLASLSTVAVNAATEKGNEIAAVLQNASQPPATANGDSVADAIANVAFAHGSTAAFAVGAVMVLIGSALVWAFLNVRHQELNDTEVPEGAGVA